MKALARNILSCALALCVAAPALAYSPANIIPDAFPASQPLAKRLAVVYDSDVYDYADALGSAYSAYGYTLRSSENQEYGKLFKLLRDRGVRVDMYPSTYFKPTGYGAAAWATLGSTYKAVLCLGFRCNSNAGGAFVYAPDTAAIKRFFDPESTTAQLIHYTIPNYLDEGANISTQYRFGTGSYTGSTSYAADIYLNGATGNGDGTQFAFTTASGDSFFAHSFAAGCAVRSTGMGAAIDSTNARVTKVVRLFKPPSSGTWPMSTVTVRFNRNTALYADTLVSSDSHEALPVAWRVYWGSAGKHVDYVCMTGINDYTNCTGQVAYAVVARYVTVRPRKVGYEWDDHGTFGFDAENGATARKWPYPDTLSNYRDMLRRYGMSPMLETTGGADSLYLMATTTQNGKTYPYLRSGQWFFVPHVHDSASAHYLGNVFGVGSHIACASGCGFATHRYAFRDSAGITAGDEWARYGIYQRLRLQDSAYVASFGARPVPYLSFTNDVTAPVDLNISSNGGWSAAATASFKSLSPDSLNMVLAAAGKLYVRGFTAYQTSDSNSTTVFGFAKQQRTFYGLRWASGIPKTAGISALTGLNILERQFTYPDERMSASVPSWVTNVPKDARGRAIIRCVGAVSATVTATVTDYPNVSFFRSAAQTILPQLMGVTGANPTRGFTDMAQPGGGRSAVRQAYNASSAAGALKLRNSDAIEIRMLYQHPLSTHWGGGYDSFPLDKEYLRVGVLDPLKALNGIAGYSLIQWVQPWEVFSK